jgi:hypothetical protein
VASASAVKVEEADVNLGQESLIYQDDAFQMPGSRTRFLSSASSLQSLNESSFAYSSNNTEELTGVCDAPLNSIPAPPSFQESVELKLLSDVCGMLLSENASPGIDSMQADKSTFTFQPYPSLIYTDVAAAAAIASTTSVKLPPSSQPHHSLIPSTAAVAGPEMDWVDPAYRYQPNSYYAPPPLYHHSLRQENTKYSYPQNHHQQE